MALKRYQPEIKGHIKTYSALITAIIGFITVIVTFVKAVKDDVSLFVYVAFYSLITICWGTLLYLSFSTKQVRYSKVIRYPNVRRLFPIYASTLTLTTLTLIGYTGYQLYYEANKINIEGIVVSTSGDPIDKATVVLYLQKEPQTLSTSSGKFNFTKIDIHKEPSKQIEIEAKWKEASAKVTIDVSNGPPKNLVIKLPVGNPPFRVTYYKLGGHAAFFLAKGELDKEWEEKLSGQPNIIPNNVYNYFNLLVNNFSAQFSEIVYKKGDQMPAAHPLTEKYSGRSVFVGGWIKPISVPLRQDDFRGLMEHQKGWNIEANPYHNTNTNDYKSILFWHFISRDELLTMTSRDRQYDEYFNKWHEFYQTITKDSSPDDFAIISMSYDDCGEYITSYLSTRWLEMRFALLENTSPYTININKFSVKENNIEKLRTRQANLSTYKNTKAEDKSLFTQQLLRPEERILIPIEITFAFRKDDDNNLKNVFLDPTSVAKRSQMAEWLKTTDLIRFQVKELDFKTFSENNTVFDLPSSYLVEMLNSPRMNPYIDKEYIYGPSMKIESVEIDNVTYQFREFDPQKVVVRSSEETGSCPYVFTYNQKEKSWVNEGHILYGYVTKDKEAYYEKALANFDGRIILKEIDPEISYLDSVFIKVKYADGTQKYLYPTNGRLKADDGSYVTMNKGDQIEVRFNGNWSRQDATYVLVAKGYYIPYINLNK